MSKRLYGPWELETMHNIGCAVTVYYHDDSGFCGTPNECIRFWYIDHNDFNRHHP